MIGVYKFTNKLNRKVYVGKSKKIEERYYQHIYKAKKRDTHFHKALDKYGIDNFDFEVLIECPEENLNYWEKFYIKYYCSFELGYNQTEGGDGAAFYGEKNGMYNRGHTEESRKLISEHYTYHTYERSEEQLLKLKDRMIGNKLFLNHKHSEETKQKQRIAALNRKPRHWYLDKETNKRIYY